MTEVMVDDVCVMGRWGVYLFDLSIEQIIGIRLLWCNNILYSLFGNNSMIYPHQYSHLTNQPNHPRTVQQKPIPINNQPHSAIHFNHPHNSPSIHPHPINSQSRLASYNLNLATNQVHIPQHQIYPPHNLSHSHHNSSHSHLNLSHYHRPNIAVQPDIVNPQAPAHLPPQTRVEYVPYE